MFNPAEDVNRDSCTLGELNKSRDGICLVYSLSECAYNMLINKTRDKVTMIDGSLNLKPVGHRESKRYINDIKMGYIRSIIHVLALAIEANNNIDPTEQIIFDDYGRGIKSIKRVLWTLDVLFGIR